MESDKEIGLNEISLKLDKVGVSYDIFKYNDENMNECEDSMYGDMMIRAGFIPGNVSLLFLCTEKSKAARLITRITSTAKCIHPNRVITKNNSEVIILRTNSTSGSRVTCNVYDGEASILRGLDAHVLYVFDRIKHRIVEDVIMPFAESNLTHIVLAPDSYNC